MLKGTLIKVESATLFKVDESEGCHGCATRCREPKVTLFQINTSLEEGRAAVGLDPFRLAVVLVHSLGLPLLGLLGGVVLGAVMQWSEFGQLALGCAGFGLALLCCRGFGSSLITIKKDEV